MPDRTTIVMPGPLKRWAAEETRRRGISFGEFIRRTVEKERSAGLHKRARTGDAFLDGLKVFDVEGSTDLSVRHDDFIYGRRE